MHTNFEKRKSFYSPLPKKLHNFSDFSSLCFYIKINNRSKKSAIISTTSSAKKYSKNKVITTTEENPDKEATSVTFQEPNIKKHKQKRKQRKFLEV